MDKLVLSGETSTTNGALLDDIDDIDDTGIGFDIDEGEDNGIENECANVVVDVDVDADADADADAEDGIRSGAFHTNT